MLCNKCIRRKDYGYCPYNCERAEYAVVGEDENGDDIFDDDEVVSCSDFREIAEECL